MNTALRSATLGGGLAIVGASVLLGLAGPSSAAPGDAPVLAAPTSATPSSSPASTVTPAPGPSSAATVSPTGTSIEVPAGNAGTAHTTAGTPAWEVAGLLGAGLTLLGGGVVAVRRR